MRYHIDTIPVWDALKQDGIRVAAGLAVVGEPSRIAEPGAGSGISTISIKQYGEE